MIDARDQGLITTLNIGCPKCKSHDFVIDMTEHRRATVQINTSNHLTYSEPDYISTLSYDYLVCQQCSWKKAL